MDSVPVQQEKPPKSSLEASGNKWLLWLKIAFLVYFVLLAVAIIGSGFKWASGGEEGAKKLFEFATDPFMGLLMGTMATALVQSSSTVTSVIVGLVAGGMPVQIAIPMIMGANIGTTVTNTIVSLGHVRNKDEFKLAFAAATIHDFFNLLCVAIFLPLEIFFSILERMSAAIATFFVGGGSFSISNINIIKKLTKPVTNALGEKGLLGDLPDTLGGSIMIVLGMILIFFSILYLGKMLKKALTGKANDLFHAAVGRGPVSGIASGTVITVLVQSSSTTTSLAVPLAGTGILSLKEVYPFTLGANIGTTITALMASTAVTGDMAVFALEIAVVHLLYNLLGVVVIYGTPFLRNIPIWLAQKLADIASVHKSLALLYIIFVFFCVPLLFILF